MNEKQGEVVQQTQRHAFSLTEELYSEDHQTSLNKEDKVVNSLFLA